MNILLWSLQAVLAVHTLIGAVWKLSHSPEQTMPSLSAIPQGVWLSMSVLEALAGLCLVAPALYRPLAVLAPAAAVFIAVEMLLFCLLHLRAGDGQYGPVIYWTAVAALCAFIAYGRFVLKPLVR